MNSRLIKDRMAKHGWTVEKLASEIGVGEYTMRNIIRGATPRAATIHLLARNLKVPVEQLCPDLADDAAKTQGDITV